MTSKHTAEPRFKLTSARLCLRDFVLPDVDAVHAYACLPEVVRHQEWGPNTIEQSREFVDESLRESALETRQVVQLAIVLTDDTLIGAIRATISDDGDDAEIGYSLHPAYWGKGYATEAASCLIAYVTGERQARRIYATSRPENLASINVLKKLGMNQVDVYKKNVLIRGEWRDTLVFQLDVR